MAAPGSDISLAKRIFFYVVILLFMAILLELFVYVFLKIKLDNYSFSSLIETRHSVVGGKAENIVTDPSLVVLHPYLGYVYDPTSPKYIRD